MKVRIFFLLFFCFILLRIQAEPTYAQEEDHGHGHDHEHQPVEPNVIEQTVEKKLSAKKTFRGYAKYKEEFKNICDALYLDGRLTTFLKIVKSLSERDPTCVACRPYMLSFSTACSTVILKKEKLAAKKKKAKPHVEEGAEENPEATPEPTATPLPYKQRDPSTELLHAASTLGNRIIEDEDITRESIKAVQRLAFSLRTKSLLSSKSETEYMDTLAEYLYAPFAKAALIQETEDSEESAETQDEPEISVDDLFAE